MEHSSELQSEIGITALFQRLGYEENIPNLRVEISFLDFPANDDQYIAFETVEAVLCCQPAETMSLVSPARAGSGTHRNDKTRIS